MATLKNAMNAIQNLEGPSGSSFSARDVERFRRFAGFTRHPLRSQCGEPKLFGERSYHTAVHCRELRFLTLERCDSVLKSPGLSIVSSNSPTVQCASIGWRSISFGSMT